ncbi:MAG: hypothetical protein V4649_00135 [Bacteroidota bacterium]
MKNYKISFSNKEIISCTLTETEPTFVRGSNVYYEQNKENNRLIYAVIKASSEADALREGNRLIFAYYGQRDRVK